MKLSQVLTVLLILLAFTELNAQVDYNTKNGYVADGYDVVSYFEQSAIKGKQDYIQEFDGAKYKFSSSKNLEIFNSNPEKYIPQYGGYCAWAIADKGEKVEINPKSFEIRDGKLFLFFDSVFANTLKKWKKNNPNKLKLIADNNWEKIKRKEEN